jgi:hypothetical protein
MVSWLCDIKNANHSTTIKGKAWMKSRATIISEDRQRILKELDSLIEFSRTKSCSSSWTRAVRYALEAAKDVVNGDTADNYLSTTEHRIVIGG